jgi:hypothetical protein
VQELKIRAVIEAAFYRVLLTKQVSKDEYVKKELKKCSFLIELYPLFASFSP